MAEPARPGARNAMNMALVTAVEAAVDEINADFAIRCKVLCAGREVVFDLQLLRK